MKKTIFGLLFLAGIGTAVAGDWYVQGGAGQTKYDFNESTDDQRATNYFGAVGYIFDNNLGIEGEYEYIDSADLTSLVETDNQTNITLYGVGRIPLDNKDKVNLLAKAGVGYYDLKVDNPTPLGNTKSDTGYYPAIAGGVEWSVTDSVAVLGLIDYKVYDFDYGSGETAADPITYKVGIQYKF